jgi:hypothetical protein
MNAKWILGLYTQLRSRRILGSSLPARIKFRKGAHTPSKSSKFIENSSARAIVTHKTTTGTGEGGLKLIEQVEEDLQMFFKTSPFRRHCVCRDSY